MTDLSSLGEHPATYQFGLDSESSLSPDTHTVQAQPDAWLSIREGFSAIGGVIQEDIALEANIDPNMATIGNGAIDVSNLNIGFHPAVPGSSRPVTQSDIFNLEKIPFLSLQPLSSFTGHGSELIGSNPFFNAAPGLGHSENQ
ncbi:MAG: hypothetical protein HOP00_01640 [Nitrospira sp.]|nr:hypothetical protein [Nitrospira sp.]